MMDKNGDGDWKSAIPIPMGQLYVKEWKRLLADLAKKRKVDCKTANQEQAEESSNKTKVFRVKKKSESFLVAPLIIFVAQIRVRY